MLVLTFISFLLTLFIVMHLNQDLACANLLGSKPDSASKIRKVLSLAKRQNLFLTTKDAEILTCAV